ncbi:MAG: VWA domain-containing protein [Planctomycetota bacterium]
MRFLVEKNQRHPLLPLVVVCVAALCAQLAEAQSLSPEGRRRWIPVVQKLHSNFVAGRFEGPEPINSDTSINALFRGRVRPEGAVLDHFDTVELFFESFEDHANEMEAILAVLQFGSLGLERRRGWDRNGVPILRELALNTLAESPSPAVLHELMKIAKDEEQRLGLRSAALLALGRSPHSVARGVLAGRLEADERDLRLAAAIGLQRHRDPRDLGALARRISRETDPLVLRVLLDTVRSTAQDPQGDLRQAEWESALWAAHARLGRFGLDVDQAIVELCASVRSALSIPALIRELRTTEQEPGLRPIAPRIRDVLVELTGAPLSSATAEEWQLFWDGARDTFELPPARASSSDPNRTTTGFFGVRVRGARVVFLIDASGSMRALYARPGQTVVDGTNLPTRLQTMIRELREAIRSLPKETVFDVVAFANHEDRLFDRLVPADQEHRRRLDKALDGLVADGGTNIHAALHSILPLDRQLWGQAAARPVDEIFLLSDGEPSVGEITSTDEILRAVVGANRWLGVRIHTISMATGGSEFLKQLAEQNGGRHVVAGG